MSRKFLAGIDLTNQRIVNLADGSSPTDAVTLQQLQAAIRGLDWKASVRAATTAAITLSGTQTVDGIALAAGDRVLVKDQATGSQNGLYAVSSGAWSRTVDADQDAEVTSGLAVSVEQGTVNGDRVFYLATDGTIVLGTTALVFSQLGGGGASYSAGNGVNITGSVISAVVKAGGGLVVDSTGLYLDLAVAVRKYAVTIGDGTATSFTITHNLNTRDVTSQVYSTSTYEQVEVDVVRTDANTLTVTFASAPASGSYRVVVHA